MRRAGNSVKAEGREEKIGIKAEGETDDELAQSERKVTSSVL